MTVKFLNGDVIDMLKTLDSESVNCIVTSPPYWGLRDYGTATWEGGDPECDHLGIPLHSDKSTLNQIKRVNECMPLKGDNCSKCGALRIDSQIGLEETPDEYVQKMVEVFHEARRVLRKDGTLWLNLGDCYVTTPPGNKTFDSSNIGSEENHKKRQANMNKNRKFKPDGEKIAKKSGLRNSPDNHEKRHAGLNIRRDSGLKNKDLVGIPWRVAFALQADGWWLRQDIIWAKPNPMPESVTDRCTKSHEYIFLLSKSPHYYYDYKAISEPSKDPESQHGKRRRYTSKFLDSDPVRGATRSGFVKAHAEGKVYETRNKRDVWTVTVKPYKEAHFATYPPDLITPCILAGCPEGGTVLDTFGGSGTTGVVAERYKRNAILIDLNPKYVKIAEDRIEKARPTSFSLEEFGI